MLGRISLVSYSLIVLCLTFITSMIHPLKSRIHEGVVKKRLFETKLTYIRCFKNRLLDNDVNDIINDLNPFIPVASYGDIEFFWLAIFSV